MDKKRILIVSANFKKAYPVIRSISKMGHLPIIVFYHWLSSPIFSKYVYKRYLVANPYTNEKEYAYQIALIAKKESIDMIIPIGFIDNVILAKYRHLFGDIIIPIPSYESIMTVSNKSKLSELLSKIGIDYPETSIFKDFISKKSDIKYPIVVKGISDASAPIYALNEYHLHTLDISNKRDLIVQQFIPGQGHGYFALARDGKVYAEFCHRRIIEDKPSGGPSIVACSYDDPELINIGRKIVSHLKWTGVIMAEFRRDYETGKYYLIELNPKFWGSLELSSACGVDFTRYLIELFLLNKIPKPNRIPSRKCFSWILSGLYYLRENYKIWLMIVRHGIKNGAFFTDLHFDDPTELAFSAITRTINLLILKRGRRRFKRNLIENIKRLFIKYVTSTEIEGILFDLDGTLIDLDVNWSFVKQKLVAQGLVRPWDSLIMAFYKWKNENIEKFNEMNMFVERFEFEAIEKIKRDNEMRATLERIKRRNVSLGIVSKQSRKIIKAILEKLKVIDLFDVYVGRDDSAYRMEQISIAIEKLGIFPPHSFFVGDTIIDITTGARMGLFPIGVSTKPYRIQQFYEIGAPCFKSSKQFLRSIIKIKKR